jgi:hypothetical protein
VIAAALLGALGTVLVGDEPGGLLGGFLIVGTLVGVTIVKPRSAFLIIPVPALAYVATASIAGLIHDRATDTSRTALAISGVQWIASGFIAMVIATGLAVFIAASRDLLSRVAAHR